MSEPKLISPLLDGFAMGNPMSSHDGVRCCPAIKENSENKYIVKIISIPASQVQLDALLLTGAYKDPADAMDYFREVSDGVVKEAETLKKLSKLEGFLPYDSWQVVPMEDGRLGYEVYLVSSYKRSLEKYMRRNVLTHLEAVNLGLDLCQALAICRRAGYLYVDLKPGNIFISRDKEYRIGDLGFAELASLAYTSLPGKYVSAYSAPETKDALKTLNETADTYAVGMILYQIYNDGALPAAPKEPTDPFPTPVNADYEIAEIILKAVAPDPKDRWKDPMAMGQALVAYMQRNTVNNTPIIPQAAINTEGVALAEDPQPEEQKPEETQPAENQPEELAFMEKMVSDETAPSEKDAEELEAAKVTDETTAILVEAEEMIAHETPEGVVVPESVPLPEPEPIVTAEEPPVEEPPKEEPVPDVTAPDEEDEFLFTLGLEPTEAGGDEADEEENNEAEEAPPKKAVRKERKKRGGIGKGWIAPVVTVLLLALLGFGGFYFYQNYYLQTIDDLTIDGSQNTLTVIVDTDVDQSLLNVICTDTYGNAMHQSLTDGKAVFTDLLPNSQYKIQLEISGFHKLVGKTTDMFNTDAQTNVVSFTGSIGPEDGSVILSLTVDGAEPAEWILTYSAEEEETKTQTFSGHNVTIKGLTIGKDYTFQLSSNEDTQLTGSTSLEYTAARIVMADDLHVTSVSGGTMTVRWSIPEDAVVESWFVRCYDSIGNEQTQEVTGNSATFSDIDAAQSYTVEVTAFGMTQPTRTSITANPITITALNVDEEDPSKLVLTWEFEGAAPEGGWLLMYGFEGSERQSVMKCEEATAVISPRVPSATYRFTLQAADSTSVFGGEQTYKSPSPEIFSDAGLSAESITGHLLKTPEGEWSYESAGKESFTDTFSVGDKLSLVLYANIGFYLPEQEMSVLYVFRDGNGNVLQDLIATDTIIWKDLWYDGDYHYGELDIPTAPEEAGNYSLSLYFDNAAVIYITFTVK